MTGALLAGAILATGLDAIAFAALIATGHVRELNPLFATASIWMALAAKSLLIVLLVALTAVIRDRARLPLVVGIAAGIVGAVSTVGALA